MKMNHKIKEIVKAGIFLRNVSSIVPISHNREHHLCILRYVFQGVDPSYDTALNEYFAPYFSLCDFLLRSCVNLIGDGMNDLQLIADTSTLLATEALHLHLIFFPKFWIDVLERSKKVRFLL